MRRLNLILGDQLDHQSAIFDDFDPALDALWMAEAHGENTHVPHHKHQIVMFLSAMRLFGQAQRELGRPLHYTALAESPEADAGQGLGEILTADLATHQPTEVRVVLPGDKRVLALLRAACQSRGLSLEVLEDRHFFSTPEEFAAHAKGRKTLRLEYFYRELRRKHDILLDGTGQPVGGQWNYDAENRASFGSSGPPPVPDPLPFAPRAVVDKVCRLVDKRYPTHLGETSNFSLPVTRKQALELLDDFLRHRLARFGEFQDALWEGEQYLYHSRLSTSLNLKLLSPAEVCGRAEQAYRQGKAPLNAVEGFIRQILGWREYIRGIYWSSADDYSRSNFLDHDEPLPNFFWTGQTDMRCLADTLKGVHRSAYSHHIQRLMISGLFGLLYGVRPHELNDWHIATHCDAIDWVSTPNVIGMSQYADGGLLASKPYCASGNYIDKMGNFCKSCTYNPKLALGEKACPFTTLYWDFLHRHQKRLAGNARLTMQLNNLRRKSAQEQADIARAAAELRARLRGV